jgi:hypothetical protein
MDVWWEIFCITGSIEAYLGSKEGGGEDTDGATEDKGDSDTLGTDG